MPDDSVLRVWLTETLAGIEKEEADRLAQEALRREEQEERERAAAELRRKQEELEREERELERWWQREERRDARSHSSSHNTY